MQDHCYTHCYIWSYRYFKVKTKAYWILKCYSIKGYTCAIHADRKGRNISIRHIFRTKELVPDADAVADVLVGKDDGVDERHDGRAVGGQFRAAQLVYQQRHPVLELLPALEMWDMLTNELFISGIFHPKTLLAEWAKPEGKGK